MFSASACNGSNNGSGALRRKQYGAGDGEREESDDPLYDAVKLGLDNLKQYSSGEEQRQ